MKNDIIKELGQNFIEYAVAVNTDRAIPDARSGLKPVAKRILYCAYDEGYTSNKTHVKCANIVGNVMAYWHPHGDSSIYGALVRLSQDWVMRYPLIDFHGANGNRDGDGPAAYRYTESRLSKLAEDGMLDNMKKNIVDYKPNYSETKDEPVTLPSIFPNLLCNPNTGIGVAMACNWAPHNLNEVAQAIYDYMDGKEPTLPGPDFPTGGLVINKDDIPNIMKTGHGSVKIRGKYNIEGNNIVFYEIPYGVGTEKLIEDIGAACDKGDITSITDIRNESNRKKGFRLVFECAKDANINKTIQQLFKNSDLQTSFSYNQVALVDKVPTELNLRDCCEIYVKHNKDCIKREIEFDLNKINNRLNIIDGLLKALEDIDNVIALIKQSESAAKARVTLQKKYSFNEEQSKAIVDMKLGKLAGLERIEIENEQAELKDEIKHLNAILQDIESEIKVRLRAIVNKYGDARRTELAQIDEPKDKKEEVFVEPEKCVVVLTESGNVKRIPSASFKTQNRNTKGIKTQDDITSAVIRTNTVDSLMVFSNKGIMYRVLVNDIPIGTNVSKGISIRGLTPMEGDEQPATIYSIYKDTDAKYVFFATKNGLVKKTYLSEYIDTKKKNGVGAIKLKENDNLAAVSLINEEDILLITKKGYLIKFSSLDVSSTGRLTSGVKGINLNDGDEVIAALPIRDSNDELAVFSSSGYGKRIPKEDITIQKRGGKGVVCYKGPDEEVAAAQLVNDKDQVLIIGNKSSICINAKDIPSLGRVATGNIMIKGNKIMTVSKV